MSKSRSETSLNAEREKSPKSAEEKSPKKVGLKRSKSLNDGQCDNPKVAVAAKWQSHNTFFVVTDDPYKYASVFIRVKSFSQNLPEAVFLVVSDPSMNELWVN